MHIRVHWKTYSTVLTGAPFAAAQTRTPLSATCSGRHTGGLPAAPRVPCLSRLSSLTSAEFSWFQNEYQVLSEWMHPYGAHGCSLPHPAGLCKSRSMLPLSPWSPVSLGEMQKPTLAADEVSEAAFPTLRPGGVKGRGNIISCSGSTVLNETIQSPWNWVTTWYILVTTLTILWALLHIGKLLLLCKREEQHVMKTSYFFICPQKFKEKKKSIPFLSSMAP